ncbi:MAG: hypothetical protein AAFW46_12675 [Pseudomonadota bacterium]
MPNRPIVRFSEAVGERPTPDLRRARREAGVFRARARVVERARDRWRADGANAAVASITALALGPGLALVLAVLGAASGAASFEWFAYAALGLAAPIGMFGALALHIRRLDARADG